MIILHHPRGWWSGKSVQRKNFFFLLKKRKKSREKSSCMVSSGHLSPLLEIRPCSHVHTHTCTHLGETTGALSRFGGSLFAIWASDLPLPCNHSCNSKICVCAQGGNAGKQFFCIYICLTIIITASLFLLKGPVWSQIDLFTSYCLDRYSKITTSLIYCCLCFIMHLMILFLHNEWVLQWETNWNASLGINQCAHTASVMGCSCSVVKVFFQNGCTSMPQILALLRYRSRRNGFF